jgi:hypothetical protein
MDKVVEIFALTNEIIEREPTEAEAAQREADRAAFQAAEAERIENEATNAVEKAALLVRLGITEAEAKLLFS